MHVHFLTDEPNKIATVRGLLEPEHRIEPAILGDDVIRAVPEDILMVDADLRQPDRIELIKNTLQTLVEIREKVFVVEKSIHAMVVQAYALGATSIITRSQEIVAKIGEIATTRQHEARAQGTEAPEIFDSARAFASLFSATFSGAPINLVDAESATLQIIAGVTQNGLTNWLDDVRRHHKGTFQHCLLVTGVSVGFALHLGFSPQDTKRLGMAATLHDIGKARIPLAILDKPGKLDPAEEAVMQRHPVIGYDALKASPGIAPEVLYAIRHHHEYLDGTGYPDGLAASDLPDLVRLLTISDIFAALIEARPYKRPMPRPKAYGILREMGGKLEPALVRAFEHVALTA